MKRALLILFAAFWMSSASAADKYNRPVDAGRFFCEGCQIELLTEVGSPLVAGEVLAGFKNICIICFTGGKGYVMGDVLTLCDGESCITIGLVSVYSQTWQVLKKGKDTGAKYRNVSFRKDWRRDGGGFSGFAMYWERAASGGTYTVAPAPKWGSVTVGPCAPSCIAAPPSSPPPTLPSPPPQDSIWMNSGGAFSTPGLGSSFGGYGAPEAPEMGSFPSSGGGGGGGGGCCGMPNLEN